MPHSPSASRSLCLLRSRSPSPSVRPSPLPFASPAISASPPSQSPSHPSLHPRRQRTCPAARRCRRPPTSTTTTTTRRTCRRRLHPSVHSSGHSPPERESTWRHPAGLGCTLSSTSTNEKASYDGLREGAGLVWHRPISDCVVGGLAYQRFAAAAAAECNCRWCVRLHCCLCGVQVQV